MRYDQSMENRYVMYFDFLGASHAARTWESPRLQDFVDLLHLVATAQTRESTEVEAMSDGSYKLNVIPEVTTFSDNVVASYWDDHGQLNGLRDDIVCQDCVRLLTTVAERALQLGILIRGGLTYGRCHHTGGVVFGEGMVDAYELESREAVNPRVLVSQKIIDRLKIDRPDNMQTLLRDTDGRWHLNYFIGMKACGVADNSDLPNEIDNWLAKTRGIIAENISNLDSQHDKQAKWKWFQERFEHFNSIN